MTNGNPSGMMQFRPLTRVETSIHRDHDVIILYLEAQADVEPEPQTFAVALTEEQAMSVGRALRAALRGLRDS